jgi:hypothetical protein
MAYLILDIETGNIDVVNEYVMRDMEATHQLYEKLKQYIF